MTASLYASQNSESHYKEIEGKWKGYFEENNKKYAVFLEISKNKGNESSYNFILTNFTNDGFYVNKSNIIESPEKILTINIEEAGLSSCEKCKFTKGEIIIKILNYKTINLSINSVGPSYWPMNDVEEGMSDISNLLSTKKD